MRIIHIQVLKMQSTLRFLSIIGVASMAAAHGIVQNITIAGKFYDLYDPYITPYENPVPDVIGWTVQSNGPVQDVTSSAIACNVDSKTGAISASAAAGAEVVLHWTAWPVSHKGPTMTYLASCDGDCSDVSDPTTLDWFKIDEAGLYSDGTWASDKLIADGNTWTLSLPSSIKAGNYVLRHELLALHSASSVGGAQFYPVCLNLEITGDGTEFPTATETVKFPGAYSATDPGIEINIYYPTPTSYDIPGPTVWSGASSGSSSSTTAAASSTATAAASSTEASSTELAATATSATSGVSFSSVETTADPTTSLSPATTFVPGTGVFTGTGTGTAGTGFSAPTSAPAVQSADPATTGADGVVTSSITSVSTSTFTSVQTIVMTKTFSETETLTVTATSSAAATGSAGLQDASSSKSTVTLTATETVTKAQTITETVTSTAQATACTPAGRFRRDLW